jgi:hypothetical protein
MGEKRVSRTAKLRKVFGHPPPLKFPFCSGPVISTHLSSSRRIPQQGGAPASAEKNPLRRSPWFLEFPCKLALRINGLTVSKRPKNEKCHKLRAPSFSLGRRICIGSSVDTLAAGMTEGKSANADPSRRPRSAALGMTALGGICYRGGSRTAPKKRASRACAGGSRDQKF